MQSGSASGAASRDVRTQGEAKARQRTHRWHLRARRERRSRPVHGQRSSQTSRLAMSTMRSPSGPMLAGLELAAASGAGDEDAIAPRGRDSRSCGHVPWTLSSELGLRRASRTASQTPRVASASVTKLSVGSEREVAGAGRLFRRLFPGVDTHSRAVSCERARDRHLSRAPFSSSATPSMVGREPTEPVVAGSARLGRPPRRRSILRLERLSLSSVSRRLCITM